MSLEVGELVVQIRGEMEQLEGALKRAVALTSAASEIIKTQWESVSTSMQSSGTAMASSMDETSSKTSSLVAKLGIELPSAILSTIVSYGSIVESNASFRNALQNNDSQISVSVETIANLSSAFANNDSQISKSKGIITDLSSAERNLAFSANMSKASFNNKRKAVMSNNSTIESSIKSGLMHVQTEGLNTAATLKSTVVTKVKEQSVKSTKNELGKYNLEVYKNTLAEYGSSAAMFQAGMMARVNGLSMKKLGIAKGFTTVMTYGLGAAMRFLTGPFGIILSLAAMLLPSLLDLGDGMDEVSSGVGELGDETAGLAGEFEGLSESLNLEGLEMDTAFEIDVSIDVEATKRELGEWKDEVFTSWGEYLLKATETEENITKVVEAEYKKRSDKNRLELEAQKAIAVTNFLETEAVLNNLTLEQINTRVGQIITGYDEEIALTDTTMQHMQDAFIEYYDNGGKFTAEGLANITSIYSEEYNELESIVDVSNGNMVDYTLQALGKISDMTDSDMDNTTTKMATHYSQLEIDSLKFRDKQVEIAESQKVGVNGVTQKND